jgi:lipid II:glycine glycyltransferase (peptidoglycan interpeptide bridge formation enzyme)
VTPRFRPATDADHAAWQDFLARTASGDFLHDWGWSTVAAHDGEPQRRFVLEQGGAIVAIAAAQVRRLRLGRSMWYVPHGPVLDYEDPAARRRLAAVAAGLRDAARRDRAIAVKLEPRLAAGAPQLAAFALRGVRRGGPTVQVGQTRIVPLLEDEALLASFDKDTRYAVRRAEREAVQVAQIDDAADLSAIDRLHELVGETQRRAGFPMPALRRYRLAWQSLAAEGTASIFEARRHGELLASAMLVVEGDRSFYLFAGSRREERGAPKRFATYALQWAMMRHARDGGVRCHDLWGIAPPGAGEDHPWYGVGLFKKGFGGDEVVWAGTWDIVVDPRLYRLRQAVARLRGAARGGLRRLRRRLAR